VVADAWEKKKRTKKKARTSRRSKKRSNASLMSPQVYPLSPAACLSGGAINQQHSGANNGMIN